VPFPAEHLRVVDDSAPKLVVMGTRACIFDGNKNYAISDETNELPFEAKDFGYRDGLIWAENRDGNVVVFLKQRGWLRMDTRDFSSSPFLIPPALVQSVTDNHPLRRGWVGSTCIPREHYNFREGMNDLEHRLVNLVAVKDVVAGLDEEITQLGSILKKFYTNVLENHSHAPSSPAPSYGCPGCVARERMRDLSCE